MGEIKQRKQSKPTRGKGFGQRQPKKMTPKRLLTILQEAKSEMSRRLDVLAEQRPDLEISWGYAQGKRFISVKPEKEEEMKALHAQLMNDVMEPVKLKHGIVNDYKTLVSDIKRWKTD